MRVAIIQESIATARGGAESSTVELARHLARLGLNVTVLFRGGGEEARAGEGVTWLPVSVGGPSRALRSYRFIQAVHRLHPRTRFDIVHAITPCLAADVYQPRGGTYPETIARGLAQVGSPAQRTLRWLGRRFNLRQRFLARLERTLLCKRRARVWVAAVSEYVRRQVLAAYRFPPERVVVVFNGVAVEPLGPAERAAERAAGRARLDLGPEAPLILFVAHNFKLKGLAELIRALALAGSSAAGWTLAVAGRDRPGPYQRLARQLGVAQQVHFVGTQVPVRQWYAAADVLAHPTWYDPCSRVVLEALSLGLPVVTTRLNGAAEAMSPGRHGEVASWPGNIPELSAALGRALAPSVRAGCQADAAAMNERLSMARHARELTGLYEAILRRAGQRR